MDRVRHALFLVEDSSDDERLAVRAISNCGVPCDIQVSRHGVEAVELLLAPDATIPELIILDFHLPGYNGLEILRKIRANGKTRMIPVVLLSALESYKEIADCLLEGANSCVRKPLDPRIYGEHVAMIVKYWLTVDRRPEQEPPSWLQLPDNL